MTSLRMCNMDFVGFREKMMWLKKDTRSTMIPHGQKMKAKFLGYCYNCYGIIECNVQVEKCDFRMIEKQTITLDDFDKIMIHLHDHQNHSMHACAEFELPAD